MCSAVLFGILGTLFGLYEAFRRGRGALPPWPRGAWLATLAMAIVRWLEWRAGATRETPAWVYLLLGSLPSITTRVSLDRVLRIAGTARSRSAPLVGAIVFTATGIACLWASLMLYFS